MLSDSEGDRGRDSAFTNKAKGSGLVSTTVHFSCRNWSTLRRSVPALLARYT